MACADKDLPRKTFDSDGRPPIDTLYAAHDALAAKPGWTMETYYTDAGLPLRVLRTAKKGPAVWLLAGIHGEEPAPPAAVAENLDKLEALAAKGIPVVLFPLCNPAGYLKGWRYPDAKGRGEGQNGHSVGDSDWLLPDKNGRPRLAAPASPQSKAFTTTVLILAEVYPPVVSVDLHEDDSLPAGYIYSQGPKGRADPAAKAALAKMRALGYPVKLSGQTDFDEKIVGGIISGVNDGSVDELIAAEKVIVGGRARKGPSGRSAIVIETSSMDMPLPKRVRLHAAVISMLEELYVLSR